MHRRRMRALWVAMTFLFALPAPSRAQIRPADTPCSSWGTRGLQGSEITVVFSLRRDGSLLLAIDQGTTSSRDILISAPIQSGNSGGPVVDSGGNLVGVVSSGLNAVGATAESRDLLQNVNFAVRSSVAASFLERNGIALQTGSPGTALAPPNLADLAASPSLYVECELP